MAKDEQYIAKKRADEKSYAWDQLINHVGRNIAEGTLVIGNELGISHHEKALRVLAAENRLARRNLANALLDIMVKTPADRPMARVVVTGDKSGTGYCFLVCPQPPDQDYEDYRNIRALMFADYCKVMKLKFPRLENVIGIATEPATSIGRSEDLLYLDRTRWTNEDREEARKIQKERGILKSPKVSYFHDEEYPRMDGGRAGPGQRQRPNRRQRRAERAKRRRQKQ